MNKSLGKSNTVTDTLATRSPQVLRYGLGPGHYRPSMQRSVEVAAEAEAAYSRIETFVRNATEAIGDIAVDESLSKASWDEFAAALDDDLGVPQALATIHSG